MKTQKVKVIKLKNKNNVTYNFVDNKKIVYNFITRLLINTIVLLLASLIFKGLYIENFFYAFIGSLLISLLNQFVKPYLLVLTMPITFFTFGLFYPFINVIILKITGLLLGEHFIVDGWFIPLIISFFISFMIWVMETILIKDDKK